MTDENKRINLRYQSLSDYDLIKLASAKSGLSVSEWTRRATIRVAEEQIHNSGVSMMLLKNVLLIRRILELAALITPAEVKAAKEWAKIQADDAIQVDGSLSNDEGSE